jgi:hypothetical protein
MRCYELSVFSHPEGEVVIEQRDPENPELNNTIRLTVDQIPTVIEWLRTYIPNEQPAQKERKGFL